MSTISGAVGGRTVTLSIADSTAAALAETIVSNTAVTIVTNSVQLKNYAAQIGIFTSGIAGAIGVPQFDYFAADNTSPAIVTGGGVPSYQAPDGKLYPLSPTETYGVLAGQGAVYVTGLSTVSMIVAGDNTGSSIMNNNLSGRLVAYTGTGGNAMVGAGLVDAFNTAQGGSDAVLFDAGHEGTQLNSLVSYGQDFVNINGSAYGGNQANAIVTVGNGLDLVFLHAGASLAFVNNSTNASAIAATAGSTVVIGGTTSTAIIAGGGQETFGFVSAKAGQSHSIDIVGNFTSQDSVVLTGYGTYAANVVNGSTVVTTGDHTQIIFAGITDASLVTQHIVSN